MNSHRELPGADVSDNAALQRVTEIVQLLKRAVNLGYTISLGPEQAGELIEILESARLEKKRPPQ